MRVLRVWVWDELLTSEIRLVKNQNWKSRLLASSVIAGATIAMAGYSVAQEAVDEEAIQETVTITGSRIAKRDYTSSSPVATVSAEQFDITGTVNTESLLNTLPQTVPGFDRTSNNPGNGTATVDLRGLGTSRTLVLVNGRRFVPTSGSGVVDINSIPTALIQSVEVVTGGASAVYGSDAVSGVVNFILKDDFEGVEASAGYEMTEQGDAKFFSSSLTIGGNFADGRGNAVLSMSYTDREALFQGDRDFSTFAQFDDFEGGTFNGGSSGIPATSIFAGGVGTDTTANCDSFGITFDPNGDVRCFNDDFSAASNDFYNYAPVNYIQLPQERFQATGLAHYEINNHAEVYGEFVFALNDVPQQLAATPIFQSGSEFSIDGNPFLTANSQAILSEAFGSGVDTDQDGIDDTGSAFLRRRMIEVGPRISDDQFVAFQVLGGIRGEINENFDYDVSYQEGRVLNSSAQRGNVSRTRFLQALVLADDPDNPGNVLVDSNGNPSCADGSSNGSTVGCSPMNIWGEGNISEGAAEFLRTRVNSDSRYNQRILAGTITGDTTGWLELPGGPIGVAGGMEYREESFSFDPSQDLASGNIAGFNGAPAIPESGFDVTDMFVEAYLPIMSGQPMVELLAAEVAYRYSDYSSIGGVEAYKIAGEWAPNTQVRFRASLNTAVRAPNIVELFAPIAEGFPGAVDPCSAAGPNPAGISAICVATGVPSALVGSPAINLAAGQVRQLSGGNPNLAEEEAETLTLGFVASPEFIDGLTVSLDYFDIEIDGAIASFGGGAANILDTCYNDTAFGGVGSAFCNAISRRADGTIESVSAQDQNVAAVTLNGFDLSADYDYDAGDLGMFALNYLATFTEEATFQAFPGADVDDCAGSFGTLLCGEPITSYKHRAAVQWNRGPITAQLLWRYIGEVNDDDPGTDYAVETIDGTSYFDASGSYQVNDTLTLTGGIDNLFDELPPILGDNQEQANTYPATYDVFGRTFFVKATARF